MSYRLLERLVWCYLATLCPGAQTALARRGSAWRDEGLVVVPMVMGASRTYGREESITGWWPRLPGGMKERSEIETSECSTLVCRVR